MKILDISTYKGDTLCVEFCDCTEKLYINRSIAERYNLAKDMDIPESAVEEIKHANTLRRARERALHLIDRSEYSYTGLYHKLEENYDEDICFEVCDMLAEKGIINDRRYAKMLAEHYCEKKRFGTFRARQELIRKGITSDIADEALEIYEESSYERLCALIEDKYAHLLTSRKAAVKVKNALARLGYNYSEINDAIGEYDIGDDED